MPGPPTTLVRAASNAPDDSERAIKFRLDALHRIFKPFHSTLPQLLILSTTKKLSAYGKLASPIFNRRVGFWGSWFPFCCTRQVGVMIFCHFICAGSCPPFFSSPSKSQPVSQHDRYQNLCHWPDHHSVMPNPSQANVRPMPMGFRKFCKFNRKKTTTNTGENQSCEGYVRARGFCADNINVTRWTNIAHAFWRRPLMEWRKGELTKAKRWRQGLFWAGRRHPDCPDLHFTIIIFQSELKPSAALNPDCDLNAKTVFLAFFYALQGSLGSWTLAKMRPRDESPVIQGDRDF